MPHFDFIDIGSSKGGSVKFCQRLFGGTGYGIDIDPRKVEQAQKSGYDVRLLDIHDVTDTSDWVTCLHVIEHLSGLEEAKELIKKMCEIGDNVLITLPYFCDELLYEHDLKFFWSDWTGHPFHCTRLQLRNILRDLGVEFKIIGWGKVTNEIIPIDSPKDSFEGNQVYEFDPPLYKETRCVIGDTSILDRI